MSRCTPGRDGTVNRLLQVCLLRIYKLVVGTGLLSTSWGRSLFYTAYDLYKSFLEAGDIRPLRRFVVPGGVVIDIGANVGFFTKRFAMWVSDGGFVMAVEPEAYNVKQLMRTLEKSDTTRVVRVFQGVAAEQSGTLKLAINPIHPGDHKISSKGVNVAAFTIDGLVAMERVTRVCLIKIDVQGAEERVLQGARATILRDYPAIYLELDDDALQLMGSSAARVTTWLSNFGYLIRRLEKGALSEPISMAEAVTICRDCRYTDLLFVKTPITGL